LISNKDTIPLYILEAMLNETASLSPDIRGIWNNYGNVSEEYFLSNTYETKLQLATCDEMRQPNFNKVFISSSLPGM
jgi:hypothetical protein